MDDTLTGLAIGAALVFAYVAYQQQRRGNGANGSGLSRWTPTATHAAAWRSWTPGSQVWAMQQAPSAPGGVSGTSALPMRGYLGTQIQ